MLFKPVITCYIAIIQTGVIFIMLTFPSASCISVIFLNHVNQIIRKLLFMQGRVGYIKQYLCICGMVIRFYSSSSCPECWPKTFFFFFFLLPPEQLKRSLWFKNGNGSIFLSTQFSTDPAWNKMFCPKHQLCWTVTLKASESCQVLESKLYSCVLFFLSHSTAA